MPHTQPAPGFSTPHFPQLSVQAAFWTEGSQKQQRPRCRAGSPGGTAQVFRLGGALGADRQEGVAPKHPKIKVWSASPSGRSARGPGNLQATLFLPTEMLVASPSALVLYLLVLTVTEGWSRETVMPGCHLHPFNVTVRSDRQGTCQGSHVAQACVGHCESSAFPSRYSVLVASGYRHNITSVSQCCTISSLKKVKVQLQCVGNRQGELEIFTARACQCDMCRLSRY